MFVYFITNGIDFKIGITANIEKRLKQLQTGNSGRLSLVAAKKVKTRHAARSIEKDLHDGLSQYKKSGEWCDLPPDKRTLIKTLLK